MVKSLSGHICKFSETVIWKGFFKIKVQFPLPWTSKVGLNSLKYDKLTYKSIVHNEFGVRQIF